MNLSVTILQIDALKKEADALQPVNPDFEQKFWNKYRLEFNYNSNHIEGNTLTYGHTQLLLMFDKVGSDSYSLRELEEMKAHDAALKIVKEAALDPDHVLSEKFIKEINQIILVRPYYKEAETFDGQPTRRLIEPGQYKKFPNNVRLENGEIFHYASVEETPAQMGDLIDWIRKEEQSKELHPVQLAALVHYRFVRIHPFDDSNGRTSRLLMNYYLMRYGYAPVVIESSDKRNYLTALNRADSGDINAFIQYAEKITLKWQEIRFEALKGIAIEESDDYKKEIHLLKKKFKDHLNKVEVKLSNESLQYIRDNSLIPLLTQIIKEIEPLDDFYFDKSVRIWSRETMKWDEITETSSIETVLKKRLNKINDERLHLFFLYSHSRLKKIKENKWQYETLLNLNFYESEYKITLNGEKVIEKQYSEIFTKEEIDEISSSLVKKELEIIKKVFH